MWGVVIQALVGTALLLAVLAGAAPAARAQATVGTPFSVCVRPAAEVADLRAALRQADGFDCSGNQRGYGPGDFWALSEPLALRSTEGRPLAMRVASLWQGDVTLHTVYADGAVHVRHIDGRTMSKHIQLGAIAQFALPPRDAPITRLAWRIDDSPNMRGVLVGTRIVTLAEGAEANLLMAALYAAFGGLAFSLIVYNLALWAALRHPFQLAYCAMVGALLLYAFSSSGALAWTFDIANNDRIRINHLFLSLAAVAALTFARSFFEPEVFRGWLGRLTTALTCLMLASGVIFFLGAPFDVLRVDRLFAWSFVALLAAVVPILWRAFALRSSYLWLFAIAWAAPIAMAAARVLHNLGAIEWRFWLDNSTIIAMSAEALLSSVAIAYRIRLLSRERDFAVAQEAVQRKLADTDPLTGLLNRRAFLRQAIGRDGAHMLLLIDIDHFKAVNETLGHDGGDEVLRVFARVLRQIMPENGLVARLGGEEFAVLAVAEAPIDADMVLARLRAARMPFDLDVTASIGVCVGPIAREAEWKSLYRCADRALFDAKAAGRDRVRRGEVSLAAAA